MHVQIAPAQGDRLFLAFSFCSGASSLSVQALEEYMIFDCISQFRLIGYSLKLGS